MRLIIVLFVLILYTISIDAIPDRELEDFYAKYKKDFKIIPADQMARRRDNLRKNRAFYKKHNSDPTSTFKLGSHERSDLEPMDIVKELCRTEVPPSPRALPAVYPLTKPAPLDWSWTNYSHPIVNQKNCGSCWAFTVVSMIEYFNKIRGINVPALSQQNIVDCDYLDGGCNGGWPKRALDFLKSNMNSRLATNSSYPYTAVKGSTCKSASSYEPVNYISTFDFNLNGDETRLKEYVANYGPVGTAMYVSGAGYFSGYKSGVFYDTSCPKSNTTFNQCSMLNHGMVIVGYVSGTTNNYWLVRNSWGTTWGEQGYIKMSMNRENNCNIACRIFAIE